MTDSRTKPRHPDIYRETSVAANYLNFALGIWLVFSPFILFTYPHIARINEIPTGALVMLVSLSQNLGPVGRYLSALNLVLGAWMVAAPFVLGYVSSGIPSANSILSGMIIVLIAALGFYTSRPRD